MTATRDNTSADQHLRQNNITLGTYFRSALFYSFLVIFTALYGTFILLASLILPFKYRYQLAVMWSKGSVGLARIICGVRYEVKGAEHIPDTPCVVMSKHQSTWETFFLQMLLTPQSTVLKGELLSIPVFGWVLKALEPVAIDRSAKRNALKQVVKQGGERLAQGRWVVIYPEGTRIQPGQGSQFSNSGALLAQKNNADILPIAHNAGECWPGKSVLLTPGVVTVSIGPVIECESQTAKALGQQAEQWVSTEMANISQFEK